MINEARRAEALKFIRRHLDEHGYPPSRREIAEHLGIATTTVQWYIDALEKQGLVKRAPGIGRGVWITEAAMKHPEVTA